MLKPNPVPLPTSFVVKNGSKMRSGSAMPVPLSLKLTSTASREKLLEMELRLTRIADELTKLRRPND